MKPNDLKQTIEDMGKYIRRETAGGFSTFEEIAHLAVEIYSKDRDPAVLRPFAERLTREAFEAHRVAQRHWPRITDCDLLDRAFGELESAGIVARHHFTCCGT